MADHPDRGAESGERPPAEESMWLHQVVIVQPRARSGPATRVAAAARRRPSFLESLQLDGRARSVIPPDRKPHAMESAPTLPDIFTIKTHNIAETREVLDRLRAEESGATVYIAPRRHVLQRASDATPSTTGTSSMNHWGMQAIARDPCTADSSGILVAVVDSGIDPSHPDLAGAVLEYINCCDNEADHDLDGHGTHVCGIIAATGDSATGAMRGVCNSKLLVLKGLSQPYDATFYYKALREACDRAKIVNLSLGSPGMDPAEATIIADAIDRGVLVIAASGNDRLKGNPRNYPAALPGVLAVGAVDAALAHAGFSNSNSDVALVAPGVDIWSTTPTYNCSRFPTSLTYAACDGTSMAAPFVTGMAARVAATLGMWDAKQIREKIPVKRCPQQSCRTDELGAGVLYAASPLDLGSV